MAVGSGGTKEQYTTVGSGGEMKCGEILCKGRFKIDDELSSGRTYRCVDTENGKNVFVKRWNRGDVGFSRERENIVRLKRARVPGFVTAWEDGDSSYIAEEWIEGPDLGRYVKDEGPLNEIDAVKVALKICEALSDLHSPECGETVFIDLKPSNIMLSGSPAESGFNVRLTDLEAACQVSDNVNLRESGDAATARLGSRYYTAPEVLFGNFCIASDIYSLGVITGFMLTGREGHPASFDIGGAADEFIATCTEHDPEKRYRNAAEAAAALKGWLESIMAAEKNRGVKGTAEKRAADGAAEKWIADEEAVKPVADNLAEKRLANGAAEKQAAGDEAKSRTGRKTANQRGIRKTVKKRGSEEGGRQRRESGNAGLTEKIYDTICCRRTCVLVEDNPCFVSELGIAASQCMGLRTGLFTLSERGRRNLEFYFTGKEEKIDLVAEKSIYPYVIDHRSMYLHNASEWRKRGLLKASAEYSGVERGTFKLGLELPLRKTEDVRRFIEWCFVNFDLTLISAERSDNAELINAAMDGCSYVVATPDSNVEDMESSKNYYLMLADSGRLLYSKVRFVAWDYTDQESDRERLFKVVGSDRYLGEVRRNELTARRKNRVEGTLPVWDDGQRGQYGDILQKLIS